MRRRDLPAQQPGGYVQQQFVCGGGSSRDEATEAIREVYYDEHGRVRATREILRRARRQTRDPAHVYLLPPPPAGVQEEGGGCMRAARTGCFGLVIIVLAALVIAEILRYTIGI
jgi:hypothetical protein